VALWRSGPGLDAEQQVRVVDALRRAEVWDGAANAIAAMLRDQPPEAVRQVLALESRLVEGADSRRHTVASALPPPARRPHVAHQKMAGRTSLFGWFRRLFGRR
jgi:hypothetical protein